jgi:hypothetical protein
MMKREIMNPMLLDYLLRTFVVPFDEVLHRSPSSSSSEEEKKKKKRRMRK